MPDPTSATFRSALTPYLTVSDATKAIAFYEAAFGAKVVTKIQMPDGKFGYVEIDIDGARLMLSDAFPEMGVVGPDALGGTPVMLDLLVEDVDKTLEVAMAAGAEVTRPVEDQFHGHRAAQMLDPFGHRWNVATKTEDLSPAEIEARALRLFGGATPPSE